MNRTRRTFRWWITVACYTQPLFSQTLTNPPVPAAAQTVQTNIAPLLPQLTKSPVESFRELLVMPSAERLKFLAVYPPEIRTRILEKIAEYQSLKPEECELRLQVTELRWYLLPLLDLPATNRAAQLAFIPPAMRELVEPRLQQWTLLPPPLRQMLLTNEQAVGYLVGSDSPADQSPALTEDQRRKLSESFKRLLELTPREKEKALRTLSDAERRQMEKTLKAFARLPQSQRARCVRSFAKFAALSAGDQQEFLKNAERWSQMSLTERQAWHELVSIAHLLPPLPPLPPLPTPRPPPYPVGFPMPAPTNGN
jgi:hypothetical protein